MNKAEKRALDKKHEADWQILLDERSGHMDISEVTGRRGKRRDHHHILGRNPPKGLKNLPEALREFWPHVPMHGIILTLGEHYGAGQYGKLMRPLLLNWILTRYGDMKWQGRTYREWLGESPFVEELRELGPGPWEEK